MEEKEEIENLCSRVDHYKKNEEQSERLGTSPSSSYLCVRLDGIGLSKKYLKNNVSNGEFDVAMRKAFEATYNVLRRKTPTDAQNIFLCAFIASDEVSVVLNSQPNYYKGRLFKTVTTIASTFTHFLTGNSCPKVHGKSRKEKNTMGRSMEGHLYLRTQTK